MLGSLSTSRLRTGTAVLRGAVCLCCVGVAVPGALRAQALHRPQLPNPLDGALGVNVHYGLALSEGLAIYDDAFARSPDDGWAAVRLAISPTGRSLLDVRLRDLELLPGLSLRLRAGASGFGQNRLYALGTAPVGNGATVPGLEQSRYWIAPAITIGTPSSNLLLSVGPVFKHTTTSLNDTQGFASPGAPVGGTPSGTELLPYGFGGFSQLGVQAELDMRWSATDGMVGRSLAMSASAATFPALLDVAEPFTRVHGEARGTVSVSAAMHPTLQLHLAATRLSGAVPFHEAAHLKETTLFGYPKYSLAGDMTVSAGAELRFTLGDAAIRRHAFRFGVLGLGDVGNVSYQGQSVAGWLTGIGGGVWLSPAGSNRIFSAGVMQADRGMRLFVRTGLSFD